MFKRDIQDLESPISMICKLIFFLFNNKHEFFILLQYLLYLLYIFFLYITIGNCTPVTITEKDRKRSKSKTVTVII